MRVLLAILGTTLWAALFVSGAGADAEADVLFVTSGSAEVGDETTVTLGVAELAGPPVGAWTVDIRYDRAVVTATECVALENSVCSPLFDEDTIRSTGASATGLFAPVDFARITFLCDEPGESRLTLSLSVWGDATGIGQLKVELQEGTITCTEPPDLITISSLDLEVGEQGLVFVEAERVAQPGVGAWTLNISYDSDLVSLVGCEVRDKHSECSEESTGTVHVRGASAEGLQSGTVLAELEFRCDRPAATELGTEVEMWSVASTGFIERLVDVEEGRITCGASQLPTTGTAAPQPASPLATVPLALLGAVLVAAAFAFRRYAAPR